MFVLSRTQCSFSVCMKKPEDNRRAAEEYANTWRSRSRQDQFECFYNTADYEDVIAEKVYSQSDVIHSMLWPSVVIVVCCAVFLRIETRRRRLTFCGRRPQQDESSPAAGGGAEAATGNRCATPETRRDVHVVVVRSSSTAGRFPAPVGGVGSLESRLVARTAAEGVKPWKSYSSLEQMLLAPSSSRSSESRELGGRNGNEKRQEAARAAKIRPMTSSSLRDVDDDDLNVEREQRKLSLTIPTGREQRQQHDDAKAQFSQGSFEL